MQKGENFSSPHGAGKTLLMSYPHNNRPARRSRG
nr:MAG TPA: Type III restriction enzyme, res subunit [Caudoviricetes sp.]